MSPVEPDLKNLRVALVHDWLFHMRGGEKVLEGLAEIFPDATINTLFYDRTHLSPILKKMKIKASFLQYLPGIKLYYRWLLPFLPRIIESIKVQDVDLVFSISHCVAKGIRVPAGARHICYCNAPMRYIWGFENVYFDRMPLPVRIMIKAVLGYLRKWDLESNRGVDYFIGNSENIAKRIRNFYNRDAAVIYPPVDYELFKAAPSEAKPSDYYLAVSAFVPYKRVDLVIEAFNRLDRKLLIVGSGPLDKAYRSLRKNEGISFLGSVDNQQLRDLYRNAKAVIFPADEDFGIVPVEAQAAGTPVIALAKGGSLETVKTGHFFKEQTVDSLLEAILEFETMPVDRAAISAAVESFSKKHFLERIQNYIRETLSRPQYVAR